MSYSIIDHIALRQHKAGFTLIELIISLAIVGIISTIALPKLSDMLEQNRAESFIASLKRNLVYARGQAALNGEIVILCPVANPNASSACSGKWHQDQILVFVDTNLNASYDKDVDMKLKVMAQINQSDSFITSGNAVRIDEQGRVLEGDGDFTYCPSNNSELSHSLMLSPSGSVWDKGQNKTSCESSS